MLTITFEPTPFAWTLANVSWPIENISAAKRTPEVIENTKPSPDQLRPPGDPDLPQEAVTSGQFP